MIIIYVIILSYILEYVKIYFKYFIPQIFYNVEKSRANRNTAQLNHTQNMRQNNPHKINLVEFGGLVETWGGIEKSRATALLVGWFGMLLLSRLTTVTYAQS